MRPLAPDAHFATPADLAACRALLRTGSSSFATAARVLPRTVRDPATALYAFCRLADDAVDLSDDSHAALAGLHERLERAYAGAPLPFAADRAFADVVARFAIPQALPAALLEGFAWDAAGRRYEDFSALRAYAARVAGTVGAMMALLMGVRAADVVARACDLGVAMQLTNIARDVGEDARAGRLYLPLAWLREAGIDPDGWLAQPVASPALAGVIQRLLRAADRLYARADSGIARLPPNCRPGIYAARLIYAEIGRELERSHLNSVTQRAVVSWPRKLALLTRAWAGRRRAGPVAALPPLPETGFLVTAVIESPAVLALAWRDFDDQMDWLIGLFERLERRESRL